MVEKPDAIHTFGLEIDGNRLKCVQLTILKGKPSVQNRFEISLDNVNALYIPDTTIKISDLSNRYLIISTLPSTEVLVRQLEIKLKKDKDIDAVLSFQAEPLIPYSIENAVLDKIKIGQTSEGTLLTILAARKDRVAQHLEQCKQWQVDPEVVSCVPTALASFASNYIQSENYYFLLHIGWNQTSCLLIQGGKLIAAQGLSEGVSHLINAYETDCKTRGIEDAQEFAQIDAAAVSETEFPSLFQVKEAYRLEILRIFYALSKQAKGDVVKEIAITGEGAVFPYLTEHLCQNLNKTLSIHPIEGWNSQSLLGENRYAIPLGAALSGLPKRSGLINFRQGDLSYAHPWKRFQKTLIAYFGLSLLLAFAFYLFGEVYLHYEEDRVRKEYVDLLAIMNKPYSSFEEEFRRKFPKENISEEEKIPFPQNLTMEDLQQRTRYLDKELQSSPDTFPLLPNVPRVSDVFAWLSTHPILSSKSGKNPQDSITPPIQIDSFSYTMVKRPEQTKKQEKYQVKVEFEFTTPTPKQAREFHDALIAPNDFVDPKGEIKWSSNRGKYRTSFFLKDKTSYPASS